MPVERTVSVIIVNFRTPALTIAAAESVLEEPETREVIVVENASGDDSGSILAQALTHPRARLIVSEKNLGFGGGNNLGVASAQGEHLFLLNSDAEAEPGTLGKLLPYLNGDIGLVGPRIVLGSGEDQDDAYGPFPTLGTIVKGFHYGGESTHPEWLTGVAMLLRKADFDAVGGFDERYFMYLEDVKLCWDLRQRGLRCERVPSARVNHLRGSSKLSSENQIRQYLKSRERFLRDTGAGPLSIATVKLGLAAKKALRTVKGS
jgi:hypothetical protein